MFWQQYFREMGVSVAEAPHKPEFQTWGDSGIYAAWLGHATVLLKVDGFTILTDPVFSTRVGIGFGPVTVGLKRLIEPAASVDDLPKVDLVLLSHAHMDHFDLPSLRSLQGKLVQVVTAKGTSDLLRTNKYARVQELGWGESVRVGPAAIEGLQVRHWGARMRTDTWRGYNGYRITIGRHRILFAGDTAYTPGFKGYGGADLALMPIGAYNPWIANHCSPEEAWAMANDARADRILPIHHQTFQLSREPQFEPIERLQVAAGAAAASRVVLSHIGQEFRLS